MPNESGHSVVERDIPPRYCGWPLKIGGDFVCHVAFHVGTLMARCSVCESPSLAAIDRALLGGGVPIAALARKYAVSRQSLYRHREHMPADGAPSRGPSLVDDLEDVLDRMKSLLENATQKGDSKIALAAANAVVRLTGQLSKLRGELTPVPTAQVNLVEAPEFRVVCAQIMGALEAHPEARAAVIVALGAVH